MSVHRHGKKHWLLVTRIHVGDILIEFAGDIEDHCQAQIIRIFCGNILELNRWILRLIVSHALWASRLSTLNRPEFHLCDRDTAPPDPPRYHAHVAAVNARPNCRARSTARKEIENYLHRIAIVEAYAENQINLVIPAKFNDFDNVPHEVARLVHIASGSPKIWNTLTEEEIAQKESRVKRSLCNRATRHMSLARLAEVDPAGDLRAWFQDISDLLE